MGLILGLILWLSGDSLFMKIAAVTITIIGAVAGIIWAERVRRGTGTREFMSALSATPELDKQEEKRNKNK